MKSLKEFSLPMLNVQMRLRGRDGKARGWRLITDFHFYFWDKEMEV